MEDSLLISQSPDGSAPSTPMPNGPDLWAAVLAHFPPGAIIAGGAVRDYLLGVAPKDIDVFFPCASWPSCGFPDFHSLGEDRAEEYMAMNCISVVQRGRLFGHQVDVVGLWFEDDNYDAERIVSTFDFGIARCWFDGELRDTESARADRELHSVTLLLHDRPERAAARFLRFNERMGGDYALVTPTTPAVPASAAANQKDGPANPTPLGEQ